MKTYIVTEDQLEQFYNAGEASGYRSNWVRGFIHRVHLPNSSTNCPRHLDPTKETKWPQVKPPSFPRTNYLMH